MPLVPSASNDAVIAGPLIRRETATVIAGLSLSHFGLHTTHTGAATRPCFASTHTLTCASVLPTRRPLLARKWAVVWAISNPVRS